VLVIYCILCSDCVWLWIHGMYVHMYISAVHCKWPLNVTVTAVWHCVIPNSLWDCTCYLCMCQYLAHGSWSQRLCGKCTSVNLIVLNTVTFHLTYLHTYIHTCIHTYIHIHTHTYSFTEPLSAQVGLNVEFVIKRAKLQYAIKSNK
jgi:hypothetical protein